MASSLFLSLLSNVWAIGLVVFFLAGTIFVHELGHFLAARWRGMIVERFSIGFGPKIFGWKRNGVEYRLSWIPLGGYVALPQLADMRGIEGETSSGPLPAVSYTDKMVVAAAGAVFNLLFALLIATVLWQLGVPKPASQTTTRIGRVAETITVREGVEVPGPGLLAGLRPGDRILRIDDQRVDNWIQLQQAVIAGVGRDLQDEPKLEMQVERNGHAFTVSVFPKVAGPDKLRTVGIEPFQPLVIAEVLPGKPAETAGLIAGDRIASVDGEQVLGFPQLEAHLLANAHRPVVIGIERDGGFISVPIQPKLETEEDGTTSARIGVRLSSLLTVRQDPFSQIWEHMTALGTALRGLISPNSDIGLRHMSGPVGIAHGLHNLARVSFLLVLWFVVLINVNLALINLLPIPVLDGGHMLFATIAKLRGRDLPGEWVQSLQAAFMIALLGAAVYVTFFDGTRLVRDLSESARPAPQATDPQTADTPETVP